MGLMHLVKASAKVQLLPYQEQLTSTVTISLLDNAETVRIGAAEAFAEIFEKCGKKVIDDALDQILGAVQNSQTEAVALDALRKITVKSPDKVSQAVVPKLLETEKVLQIWGIKCLSIIGEEAGAHFGKVMPQVLERLAKEGSQKEDEAR